MPDVNRRWFVHYVSEQIAARGDLRVLDFGCGAGTVVRLLRERGIDAWGADIFYAGADWDDPALRELIDAGTIRRIGADGRIPFGDGTFDLVISDQVLEHVEDLPGTLREIDRVLKSGGISYHHFPTRDGLREGHIGIPLAHRFKPGRLRFAWTLTLRRAGLGVHKAERPDPADWTRWKLEWIDRFCFYRSNAEIETLLGRDHTIVHREVSYCRFRAAPRPGLRRVLAVDAIAPIVRRTFQRLGFTAVELHAR
jgi:SAM-dependent methyltransferase